MRASETMAYLLKKNSGIWQWAFFGFVLAGLTGFLFRLGFAVPIPFDIDMANVRHAHSHLMFFVWASLLPLYLIKIHIIPGYYASTGAQMMRASLWIVLIFGLLSYPSFLFWGYAPVPIGSKELPISAILSGMVMIGWYLFMAGYLIHRFRVRDFKSNVWFESALVLLFVSSLGAWGVGLSGIFEIGSPLFAKALTHFFLSTFTEGWVVLVLLGLLSVSLKLNEDDYLVSPLVLAGLIALGAPLTFPYGMAESLISISLSVSARVGGLIISQSILIFICTAVKSKGVLKSFWIWPLIYLLVKALMQLTASFVPAGIWLSSHGIGIMYLHVLLLGALTTGLVLYIAQFWEGGERYLKAIMISVLLVILSLILVTKYWPVSWSGSWVFKVLAGVSLLPPLSIFAFWMRLVRIKDDPTH